MTNISSFRGAKTIDVLRLKFLITSSMYFVSDSEFFFISSKREICKVYLHELKILRRNLFGLFSYLLK